MKHPNNLCFVLCKTLWFTTIGFCMHPAVSHAQIPEPTRAVTIHNFSDETVYVLIDANTAIFVPDVGFCVGGVFEIGSQDSKTYGDDTFERCIISHVEVGGKSILFFEDRLSRARFMATEAGRGFIEAAKSLIPVPFSLISIAVWHLINYNNPELEIVHGLIGAAEYPGGILDPSDREYYAAFWGPQWIARSGDLPVPDRPRNPTIRAWKGTLAAVAGGALLLDDFVYTAHPDGIFKTDITTGEMSNLINVNLSSVKMWWLPGAIGLPGALIYVRRGVDTIFFLDLRTGELTEEHYVDVGWIIAGALTDVPFPGGLLAVTRVDGLPGPSDDDKKLLFANFVTGRSRRLSSLIGDEFGDIDQMYSGVELALNLLTRRRHVFMFSEDGNMFRTTLTRNKLQMEGKFSPIIGTGVPTYVPGLTARIYTVENDGHLYKHVPGRFSTSSTKLASGFGRTKFMDFFELPSTFNKLFAIDSSGTLFQVSKVNGRKTQLWGSGERPNSPPLVVNDIEDDLILALGDENFDRTLAGPIKVFDDPDNDGLTYTISVDPQDTSIVKASVTHATLHIEPISEGVADITITANDGVSGSVSTSFTTTVVKPPKCDVSIISPRNRALSCTDSITTILHPTIQDGTPPFVVSCEVNGLAAQLLDSTYTVTVPLKSSKNWLFARCQVTDSFGFQAICVDSILVKKDTQPPYCEFAFSDNGIKGTFYDNVSGIAEVLPIEIRNGHLTVDSFEPGDKKVDFRIDIEDPDRDVFFSIDVLDRCGLIFNCDPVYLTLSTNSAVRQHQFTFPAIDRYFQLTNRGLSEVSVNLNGKSFALVAESNLSAQQPNAYPMPINGKVTLDMQPYLNEGLNNMSLTFTGPAGTGAAILIGNEADEIDFVLDLLNIPESFSLLQNYPNPFNAGTTIRYTLPKSVNVSLKIYNAAGQKIAVLVDESQNAGFKSIAFSPENIASGLYFYRLTAGDFVATRKFVLLK